MRLFSRPRTHVDFSDEVQSHLDLETDRLIADGMSPDAARAAAQRAFGNVTIVRERFYEASRWTWLEQLRQDVQYAARGMRHSPAFVATTVLTLAVGLGLLTVAFTIVNVYVLDAAIHLDTISLLDIGAFAAGVVLVLVATLLAAYQPARRATRINPSETLRADA